MSVEFEEEEYASLYSSDMPTETGMVGWLIRLRLVHTRREAHLVLIGISLIFIALSVLIILRIPEAPEAPSVTPYEEAILREQIRIMEVIRESQIPPQIAS